MNKSHQSRSRFADCLVVLARPQDPVNIGTVCRVMKQFSFDRLAIVSEVEIDLDAIGKYAGNARDICERAEQFPTISDAVKSAPIAIAISRRWGQRRKPVYFTVVEAVERVVENMPNVPSSDGVGAAAFVFGNESTGLSDEEIQDCHLVATIPSSRECPSLNLSHAVAIVLYELSCYASSRGAPRQSADDLITGGDLDREVATICTILNKAGFLTQSGPQGMHVFLRDVFARASLTRSEMSKLLLIFDSVGRIL